jgi:hypothetical protein
MQLTQEADVRLAQFRAALRLQGARRAFDLLLESSVGYRLQPAADSHRIDCQGTEGGEPLFSFELDDGDLLLSVHPTGQARIAGGAAVLEAALGALSVTPSGAWQLQIARPAQAETLARLLFPPASEGASEEASERAGLRSRHWCLNTSQAELPEIDGAYLWSPKKVPTRSNRQLRFGLTGVAPGDIVFVCTAGSITTIGLALDRARSSPDPRLTSSDGWVVPMRFQMLDTPLAAKPHLPRRARPRSGARVEHELSEISDAEAATLRRAAGQQVEELEARTLAESDGELIEQAIEEQIWLRTDIAPVSKRQLSAARLGRGVFRDNVERLESACRVTGILDRRYLRVTHIKPWKDASDAEKIDGANGLLLSPHIIHLFRRGHISFADDGSLLVSRHLNPYVLKAWNLQQPPAPRAFTSRQRTYLAYHRGQLFERVGGGRRTP